VFGQDDIGPEEEVTLPPRLFHGIHKPSARAVPAQLGKALKAREGQLVGMAGLVVALHTFCVELRRGPSLWAVRHAFAVRQPGTLSLQTSRESMAPSAFSLAQPPAPGEPIFVDFVHLKRQLPMARVLDQLGLTSRLKGKGPQKRCTCPIHRGAARTRFTRLSTLSSRLSRKTCGPVSRVCHCVTRPST